MIKLTKLSKADKLQIATEVDTLLFGSIDRKNFGIKKSEAKHIAASMPDQLSAGYWCLRRDGDRSDTDYTWVDLTHCEGFCELPADTVYSFADNIQTNFLLMVDEQSIQSFFTDGANSDFIPNQCPEISLFTQCWI